VPRCSAESIKTASFQCKSPVAAHARTCAFSSARTTTAALLLLTRKTGVRPAMLPKLERLLETRADAQGTLTALELAATCMIAAVRRSHLCPRQCPGPDKTAILDEEPNLGHLYFSRGPPLLVHNICLPRLPALNLACVEHHCCLLACSSASALRLSSASISCPSTPESACNPRDMPALLALICPGCSSLPRSRSFLCR
jgi:hypothetical protein